MISFIAKLLSVLSSDTKPSQIALAVALALLIGFNGFLSIVGLVVILLIFIVRFNISMFLAMSAVFTVLALIVSPLTHQIGEALLTHPALNVTFTNLYQTYWFRLDELNHTVQMGELVASLILFIPVYLLSILLVNKYRSSFMAFVNKFKVVQSLKASKFYRIYSAAQGE